MDSKQLIETVMSITSDVQINMVHKDDFLDLKAESGNLLKNVHDLNVFQQKQEVKQTDDHY